MTPRTLPACVALGLLAFQDVQSPLPTLPLPDVVAHRVTVLRDWVSAVERHTPGELDAAVSSVSAWSRDDVVAAWTDVQVLIALLKDKRANTLVMRPPPRFMQPPAQTLPFRTLTTKQDLIALQELAARMRVRYDPPDPFFRRAALLHSDIAMSLPTDDPSPIWSSMMSPRRGVVRAEDGQQLSVHGGMVHWEFGRVLLDAVRQRGSDEFVRSWYRATLAHKLDIEDLDTPHFEHARFVLPDDPEIRFLLGCLYEAFADSRVQRVVASVKIPPRTTLEVRSERDELREAEGLFRRALELDTAHVEARLRLGRTLGRFGKHKEAAAELRLVVDRAREPQLTYYAQLFLGAEEEALGRLAEARAAYEAAARLYPRAQSPKLALSHLAHRTGDRAAARAALSAVLQLTDVKRDTDDPWWSYRIAAGRRADEMMATVHRSLTAGAQR